MGSRAGSSCQLGPWRPHLWELRCHLLPKHKGTARWPLCASSPRAGARKGRGCRGGSGTPVGRAAGGFPELGNSRVLAGAPTPQAGRPPSLSAQGPGRAVRGAPLSAALWWPRSASQAAAEKVPVQSPGLGPSLLVEIAFMRRSKLDCSPASPRIPPWPLLPRGSQELLKAEKVFLRFQPLCDCLSFTFSCWECEGLR